MIKIIHIFLFLSSFKMSKLTVWIQHFHFTISVYQNF